MKVSVIVPVYNVEKYLEKCLDSLVNQTFKDYEIIVVNDGSLDNSEKIIKEYEKKYNFIKVYKKKNGGLSSARNYGLKYASGEYILFVDSDDYVESDMIESLYDKITCDNIDIVIGDYYSVINNEKKYVKCHVELSSNPKCNYLLSPPTVCAKLFKKELFEKEIFTEKIYYEDLDIRPRLLPYINKISFVDKALYNYIIQENGSIMSQPVFSEKLLDIFTVLENNKKILEKDYFEELEYLYISHLLRTTTLRFLNYPNTLKYLHKINDIMKKDFPNWRKNIYYQKSSIKMKLICFLSIHECYLILKLIKKIINRR